MIASKDLRIEARSGEVTTTSAFFAALVVLLSSLAFQGGPTGRRWVAAGSLWLTIAFSAVLALSRSWQRERQDGAFNALMTTPLRRSALFAGKTLSLLLFLGVVQCVVLPLSALFFSLDLWSMGGPLLLVSLLALPGIAATGTLFGAMTVRSRARELVLAVVLFPLLAPSLLAATVATRELLGGMPLSELGGYLTVLVLFDAVFVAGGLLLFGLLLDG